MGIRSTILCLAIMTTITWHEGLASWYAYEAPNLRTANGERWKPDGISTAHKTLPFGTLLEVVNLQTDQTLIVRVNDRGPYVKGRILDLSRGAAKALGVYGPGVAKIKYRIIENDDKV